MRRITKAIIIAAFMLAAPASAQAARISQSQAESIWYSSNYAGACGAGAGWYCAQKNSWDCSEAYGALSRRCVGYYVRGPGWPVTSKIHCYAEGFVNASNQGYFTNYCWA